MVFRKFIALFLAIAMILTMAACTGTPEQTKPTTVPTTAPTEPPETTEAPHPTTEPVLTTEELYAKACGDLNSNSAYMMTVKSSRTITYQGEIFKESSTQNISLCDIGLDTFSATLKESTNADGYITTFDEVFCNGTMYTTVDNSHHYRGVMTAEEYLSRLVPLIPLDAALYGSLVQEDNLLRFTGATGGETWLMPEYAEFVEASGTATLDDSNALTGFTYSLTYAIGDVRIATDVSTQFTPVLRVEAVAPIGADEYIELEYIDAPRMIEAAAGYVSQTASGHSVTSTLTESILCQAAGVIRNQNTTINSYGVRNKYMAEMDISLYMNNMGESSSYDQTEHFENGCYTFSADGSEPEKNLGVNSVAFQEYCLQTLGANIPSLDLLEGASAEDLGSLYYLELTLTPDFGKSLGNSISNILFQDENFLNDLASAYRTTTMDVYLAIDKYTGLPTALGYNYEGYHTIEGQDYLISLHTSQAFDMTSASAYEAICEEQPPVEEPVRKATPLFYHVTGPNGQEMWLLGTIHVGDARTAYLPQEIYAAFDASDALAVEFNSEAFDENLENDDALSEQVSNCYFYDDGSTTQEHIVDEELYDYALKLMKATGNYHMNAPYMKAYFWSSAIDSFYLTQGHDLSSLQGVDNQLIWRAEDQNKTILDVESGLFQLQMLSGFSDGLQEMLLLDIAATDALEYIQSTKELFDLWCSGDEAKLIEYLNDEGDDSELTAQEKALVEEYNNAMGTDRNDDMHDTAVSYLESGQVIFFAVGLAHLLAEDGLVNTLRDAGYTVELVPYA